MFNKKFKNVLISGLLCMAVATTCVAAGCADDTAGGEGKVVSYVAAPSITYNSTAEVVAAVADTVVEISTETVKTQWGQQYIVSGAGSGVIVGCSESDYYIVTNNHVIEGANDISVTTRSGVKYDARLVATDDSADIAVVTVTSETELPLAVWGDSDTLMIGEDLIAIGNPLGSLGGTVTKGILSATGRSIAVGDYYMTLLQTDTAINPGNSGGGLFNLRGELIGVVNAKTSDEDIEGICFAIPANYARGVCGDLLEYGYIKGRATLNLKLAEGSISTGINTQSQGIAYLASAEGWSEDTFRQYDRIYKINGKEISCILDYNTVMAGIKPGDKVDVEVFRGNVTQGWLNNSISFATEITTFSVTALQYGE